MFVDDQRWEVQPGIFIRVVPDGEYRDYLKKHTPKFFDEKAQVFRLRDGLAPQDMEKATELSKRAGSPIELRLGLFKNEQFIGWSFCRQELSASLYMQTSAVFPDYRRSGLYSELVKKAMELGREAGFLSIFSRHVVTNNAVIIAKLKLGFRITSLELTDSFGTLVHLTYFPHPLREKILDYRAGFIKPDDEIRRLLKL